jgi:hypothetical protein
MSGDRPGRINWCTADANVFCCTPTNPALATIPPALGQHAAAIIAPPCTRAPILTHLSATNALTGWHLQMGFLDPATKAKAESCACIVLGRYACHVCMFAPAPVLAALGRRPPRHQAVIGDCGALPDACTAAAGDSGGLFKLTCERSAAPHERSITIIG